VPPEVAEAPPVEIEVSRSLEPPLDGKPPAPEELPPLLDPPTAPDADDPPGPVAPLVPPLPPDPPFADPPPLGALAHPAPKSPAVKQLARQMAMHELRILIGKGLSWKAF